MWLRSLVCALGCIAVALGSGRELQRDTVEQRVYVLPGVRVVEERLRPAEQLPGAFYRVDAVRFEELHAVTLEEVLRLLPGAYVRPEDALGLRINLGVRGLPPNRSQKVLVLEDGVPVAPAPYGYPELYYHPPLERFTEVELVTGGGQLLYGPQTIGGVVNYITPLPQRPNELDVVGTVGTRAYGRLGIRYGTAWGESRMLLYGLWKRGQLNRENTASRVVDVGVKGVVPLAARQWLLAKLSVYDEQSQTTYAGLTQAQFEENPYQNPFRHDTFEVQRYGAQLQWQWELPSGILSLGAYAAHLQRDWWRQGSLVRQQTPDGRDTLVSADNSADPGNYPGVRAIPSPDRADGRLRQYRFAGLEGRATWQLRTGTLEQLLELGVRLHGEQQHRYQLRAPAALARTGTIVEDDWRWATAVAAFLQDRLRWRQWSATLGLRTEWIGYRRWNALGNGGLGAGGRTTLAVLIPALGVSYTPTAEYTLFFGLHAGFAPPRVEDAIAPTGATTELDAERSWNWELGLRAQPISGINLSAVAFLLDFRNQVIPATLSGGVTSTATNAGRTRHQGIELAWEVEPEQLLTWLAGVRLSGAYTFVPVARYEGERYSVVRPQVRITGNRLPYAPEHLLALRLQWKPLPALLLQGVLWHVGAQFADDLNTLEPTPNGRQGRIPAYTVVDGTLELQLPFSAAVVLTVKNLFNRVYIVDRTRGIIPGAPRSLQVGFELRR
jgi:Fe(3+) dicitrate transport protein